jgi:hypothetical protein
VPATGPMIRPAIMAMPAARLNIRIPTPFRPRSVAALCRHTE